MAQDYLQKRVSGIKDSGKRKSAYYKLQREQAEEGGDQDTTDKIYKKLGKASHNVDSDRGNKAILGAAPFLPEAIEGLGARAAVGAGRMALGAGRRALAGAGKKEGGELAEAGVQRLRTPTPVKKALGSSNPALTTVKQSAKGKAAADARRAAGKPDHWFQEKSKPQEPSKRKALGTSGQWHYEKELGKQAGRKLPKEPKTFNRNGTKRAEGRQKSDRNPVSARAKAPNSHAAIDKMGKKLGASEKNPGGFAQFDKKGTTERIRAAKSKHMDEWSQ